MGLGHFGGGAAAARWLARQGAIVTVTDLADENALADVLPRLADVPIAALHLGGHREEDFRQADLVVVNPAVRPNSPWLQIARNSGVKLRTELELFIEHCPARIIGVTGTNGKSTTAAMIASILREGRGESQGKLSTISDQGSGEVASGQWLVASEEGPGVSGQGAEQGAGNEGSGFRVQDTEATNHKSEIINHKSLAPSPLPSEQVASGQWLVASEADEKSRNPKIPKSPIPNPQSLVPNPLVCCPRSKPLTTADGAGHQQSRRTFLGGNIGGSLLEDLPQIGPNDWVVLEISSFQLWYFSPEVRMPHVAVVTGCQPNHLDWHADFAEYVSAKQRILLGQTPADFAVLNTWNPEVATWANLVRGRQLALPSPGDFLSQAGDGGFALSVPGEHNRINAACAAAAASAVGCSDDDIRRGLESYRALPQRLEWFATVEGRRFYNDSAATTPESTIAALRSLDRPVWLLVGGKSKGADFGPLTVEIVRRACGVATFGATAQEIYQLLAAQSTQIPCVAINTMKEALQWCWTQSQPGDAILLSPACASTDQFRNFRQRGEQFVELVDQLRGRTG